MAETPTPYIRKEPGDIMLAADWNEIQVRARTELRTHDHTGDATRIPRDGIADKAIDGSKVDPESRLTLKGLAVGGPLKVSGTAQLADIQATLASLSGDLAVGTDAPENGEGWSRVVDILGGAHAKLSIRAGGVDGRVMAHGAGIYGADAGLIVGTRSAHPLSLIVGGEMRLRLGIKQDPGLPILDLFPSQSLLRISASGRTGTTTAPALGPGEAEIRNDTDKYQTLMLMGNRSAGLGRRVSVWDRLEVNGALVLDYTVDAPPAGTPKFAIWNKRDEPSAPEKGYLSVTHSLNIVNARTGDTRFQLNVNDGVLQTDVLRLGKKWRMSAVGDAHGNDGWLRLFNADNTGYYGGLAAGELWTAKGSLSGSDLRLKENVRPLENATASLGKLRGVHFDWRSGGRSVGLIAQEVEAVLPDAVAVGPDGWKGINPTGVIALLVEAVKEQQAMIDELRAALPAHS